MLYVSLSNESPNMKEEKFNKKSLPVLERKINEMVKFIIKKILH